MGQIQKYPLPSIKGEIWGSEGSHGEGATQPECQCLDYSSQVLWLLIMRAVVAGSSLSWPQYTFVIFPWGVRPKTWQWADCPTRFQMEYSSGETWTWARVCLLVGHLGTNRLHSASSVRPQWIYFPFHFRDPGSCCFLLEQWWTRLRKAWGFYHLKNESSQIPHWGRCPGPLLHIGLLGFWREWVGPSDWEGQKLWSGNVEG